MDFFRLPFIWDFVALFRNIKNEHGNKNKNEKRPARQTGDTKAKRERNPTNRGAGPKRKQQIFPPLEKKNGQTNLHPLGSHTTTSSRTKSPHQKSQHIAFWLSVDQQV